MDRSKINLIRPLIYTPEKEIRRFIRKKDLTVMPKVCPMDGTSKREDMKQLIFTLTKNIPMIRANLFGAIQRNLKDWKIRKREPDFGDGGKNQAPFFSMIQQFSS